MPDSQRSQVEQRYKELKRLLASYTSFLEELPVRPQRGNELGRAFHRCVLEAHFLFPGFTAKEREELAILRLTGINILARYLMIRLSPDRLANSGFGTPDKKELDRVLHELEAEFVPYKNEILAKGIVERMTEVQKLFWEEWSNPFQNAE